MKRILIVEDEQDIQELLEAYLGDAGYETATAGDGIEAVSLFQQEAFDLVLLDVMLPKLDGFGVCELIRRQSRVPIVLLTALDGEAEQLRGFDLEIDDYITKPFSMPILLRKLAAVLRRGTVSCPDMGALSAKMDNLYDASIDYTVRKKGENQCVGFVASFIDDRYAPDGERLLEPAAALLGELICDPVTYHGRFVPEYFESEKTNLLEAIRSLINDKRDWADSRLLRALCDGEAYAVPRLGDEETVDKLQALKVYTQYRDLISTAPLEIIYSGSADLERVKQALAAAFATLPREEVRVISTAAPHVCRESVQHVEDVLDVTQGKLGMGFSCGSDDMPALLMGNTLFGGSSNSKLFLNVREKLSLCYYASSLYHRQKGLITVSSGIEFQNYQRAYDEIMAQLEAVQKGELEDWELEGARSTLLNNYATVGDSQGKLENFYLGQAATGQHETPADLARAIQDMTAERICRAMSTVKLDTVYFLKGKEGEA